jgi:toxin ParE1/3/4
MIRRLIIRAEAEADISDAALWYQAKRAGLGEEFITEVRAAIESAAANPRKYRRLRRRPEVRRVLTRRFPYRVFFVLRVRCHCRISSPPRSAPRTGMENGHSGGLGIRRTSAAAKRMRSPIGAVRFRIGA